MFVVFTEPVTTSEHEAWNQYLETCRETDHPDYEEIEPLAWQLLQHQLANAQP